MTERDPAFDELSLLLGPTAEPGSDRELKGRIWLTTSAELARRARRRRRHQTWRRLAAAACVALAVASVLSIKNWRQTNTPRGEPAQTCQRGIPIAALPAENWVLEGDPRMLEQAAHAAIPAEQERLFELAGDRYLEAGQVAAALRCYAFVVDSDPSGLSDSWLLSALKRSKQGGIEYVPSDG